MKTIKITIEQDGKPSVIIEYADKYMRRYGEFISAEIGYDVARAIKHMKDNTFPLKSKN